jgi:enterochelin esterase-like enzyme/uncharacterized membrane protein
MIATRFAETLEQHPTQLWFSRVRAWAYTPEEGRDLRIDLLRGLAVLAMVIDHLAGPSRLYLITGGNRFYTSAAEGFIFLSGMTVGLVYRRIAEQQGLATAIRRLVARAWTLYVLAIGLTLVMLPASEVLKLPWAFGIEETTPLQIIWAILSLHQTYYLVDVLTLYVLLMLGAPLALFLLCERRTSVLLATSWLIWAGFQVFPQQTDLPWPIAGNNLFYLSAWQALFFTAMAIGFHRQRVSQAIPSTWQPALLVGLAISFAALVVVYVNQSAVLQAVQATLGHSDNPGSGWSVADLEDALFAKGDVRPGRALTSLVVFGFLFSLTTQFWSPIRRGLGWLLLPLGRNALYAYSTHVILALGLGLLSTHADVSGNASLNALIQAVSIGLIWLAIRIRVLYPTPENRGRWMAAVIPLAAMAFLVFRLEPSSAFAGAQSSPDAVLSDAARQARAFGTPITRTAGGNPGRIAVAPASPPPDATPEPTAVLSIASIALPAPLAATNEWGSASDYIGSIGGSFREVFFYSPSLDRDMSYYVYLPPGYGTESRRYPVLYMLHGGGGSKDEWPAYGLVNDVDQSIASKDIAPLIIILPQGDEGYWVNWANGGPRWGDYLARDVRRQVDSTYRTLPDAAHRAIGGLSMGGSGALQLGFNHPDIFGIVGAHSPSLHVDDNTFSQIYGMGVDFAQREPIDLAADAPNIDSLKIWIDAGQDDPWLDRDEMLEDNLDKRGIAHNWNILDGGHNGEYWIQNLPLYLRFYDSALSWSTIS